MDCGMEGCEPFERVTLMRDRDSYGEPIGWYTILGERQGGERTVRVPATTLLQVADDHFELGHSISVSDPIGPEPGRRMVQEAQGQQTNGNGNT